MKRIKALLAVALISMSVLLSACGGPNGNDNPFCWVVKSGESPLMQCK